jgi:ribosomal-protein-alanine N-acetyltransferase
MALLQSVLWSEPLPVIHGDGVFLRIPQMADWNEWARLREASRDFLVPWEPLWPSDDLTHRAFRRRLRRYAREMRDDLGYPFLIFRTADRALLGGITLTNIRRGVAQVASLGYWTGAPFAGKGYMTAALAALIPFAHGTLRLKRIEAACLPHNVASVRLLERLGFVREGYAREYLCIAGKWQDHLLFARRSDGLLP